MENSIHGITIDTCNQYLVYDTDGNEYIDFSSGIFSSGLGMGNPHIARAISFQAEKLMHSYQYGAEIRDRYLKRLCKFTGFESAYMFSSGTEAVEAAYKIARRRTGKDGIWGLTHAFHGKTLGAQIAAGQDPDWRSQTPGEKTACLIFEPYVAATAGFHDDKTIDRIKHLVKEFSLILIADEIQAGLYRTGKLFGYQWYPDLKPDMVCIGKQMCNGFPASAVLGPSEWVDDPLMDLSSTNGGNPLACAAGNEVLRQLGKKDSIAWIQEASKIFQDGLQILKHPVQGRGLVASIWFEDVAKADKAVVDLAKNGLLVVHTKKQTVKLAPNLNVTREALCAGLKILGEVLNASD